VDAAGIALVTGAGRGLGRAIAIELARRGFEVVAGMRRPEAPDLPREVAGGGSLRATLLDVTRPDTIAIPPGLRVLVNNAGTDAAYLPVEHAPLSLWRELFETNLLGVVEVTRRAIPALRAAGGGVVCNLTSASLFTAVPFFAAYRASKAAVAALSESLAVEVAGFGIRVIDIAPGPIATDMLAASDGKLAAAALPGYEHLAAWLLRGRRAAAALTVRPEAAAARIADAILDDGAPLRNACDPLGETQLAAARRSNDDERLRAVLEAIRAE
jgi:NAD(P)-dependent dehydrogenase (short-subunit alcohol dehydrogenase family)